MGHCVATFATDAGDGDVQVLVLNANEGEGRATVVLDPPPQRRGADDYVQMEIAAPGNGPLCPRAFVALGELLEHLGGEDLLVTISIL